MYVPIGYENYSLLPQHENNFYTYSKNNMIHFIIWSQTMSSSQNMSNRIKDKRFTKAILESWLASEVKTKIFLIILFLFPLVFYLLVIKAPPQRYLYFFVFVSFLYAIPTCQGRHPWVTTTPFVILDWIHCPLIPHWCGLRLTKSRTEK